VPPVGTSSEARIHSIQVGRPRHYGSAGAEGPLDRPWTSSIVKDVVMGPRWVRHTNIDGDRQADLENHGGPDKAVLAYAVRHYPAWREELPEIEFPMGAFGENLTLGGLTEEDVAIGDIWAGGTATFQVSQPRQPCWKLARRLRVRDMVVRVQSNLRSGWYLRVLEEGEIQAGDVLTLEARTHPSWTVAEASRAMYGVGEDPRAALELAGLPELSASWKRTLHLRASKTVVDTTARTEGPES